VALRSASDTSLTVTLTAGCPLHCHRLTGDVPTGSLHFRARLTARRTLYSGWGKIHLPRRYWTSAIWRLFSTVRATIFNWALPKQASDEKQCQLFHTLTYFSSKQPFQAHWLLYVPTGSTDHPPYFPDLAPSDYHPFPGLKKQLKCRRFSSDAETWLDG